MLPVMAAGLCSIIFSIPIDVDYLNTSTRVDVPLEATPPPVLNHPPTIINRMADNNGQIVVHCVISSIYVVS